MDFSADSPDSADDEAAPHAHKSRMAYALQRERNRLGLSLSEAAKQAGVSKSTLSQLEAGTGNPSVETLWALATSYGVQLSRLIDPPRATMTVLRRADLHQLPSSSSHYAASLLSAGQSGVRRDVYLITAEPGPGRVSSPHPPGTVEHIVLSSGRARVECEGEVAELGPGDFLTYPGDLPHAFEALEEGTVAIFVIDG